MPVRRIRKGIRYLKEEGIVAGFRRLLRRTQTAARSWNDGRFDRKYGTETGGIIDDINALGISYGSKASAFGYEGIQRHFFEVMIRNLKLAPEDYVFVDFGSGKGRAVMLAAEKGFKQAHGVEFSPLLHKIAEENLDIFCRKNAAGDRVILHCQDAVEFAIPDGDLVCFFYNPFDAEIMNRVLGNIHEACLRQPRSLAIAYRNPVCADVFERAEFLTAAGSGKGYRLYRSL